MGKDIKLLKTLIEYKERKNINNKNIFNIFKMSLESFEKYFKYICKAQNISEYEKLLDKIKIELSNLKEDYKILFEIKNFKFYISKHEELYNFELVTMEPRYYYNSNNKKLIIIYWHFEKLEIDVDGEFLEYWFNQCENIGNLRNVYNRITFDDTGIINQIEKDFDLESNRCKSIKEYLLLIDDLKKNNYKDLSINELKILFDNK